LKLAGFSAHNGSCRAYLTHPAGVQPCVLGMDDRLARGAILSWAHNPASYSSVPCRRVREAATAFVHGGDASGQSYLQTHGQTHGDGTPTRTIRRPSLRRL